MYKSYYIKESVVVIWKRCLSW